MAASRALCARWTLQFSSSCGLPLRNPRAYKHFVGAIYSPRRFSNEVEPETPDDKSSEARNLFEVYESNSSLLTKPRDKKEPFTEEEAQREIKRQQRLLRKTPVQIEPGKYPWTSGSKRVGAIGVKLGMSALWLKDGRRMPVTLIQDHIYVSPFVFDPEIKECEVVQARIARDDGGVDHKTELQVGAVDEPEIHKVRKAQFGHFRKACVRPKKKVCSFSVTKNALLHPGTPISAAHFYPGQFVKIQGVSTNKGFQGVMKRWGMKGQPASHGQTKTHRKMGATGGGQDPGRIWPGKKMPGHMGGNNCTLFALKVFRVNTKYNVLYVKGQCPGSKGDFLIISDAWKKHTQTPPFPTLFPNPDEPLPEDLYAENVQQFTDESIAFAKSTRKSQAG